MKTIRIGICVLLTFAVAAHGAVEPWSEGVLEMGALVLLVWWGLCYALGWAQGIRWNWLLAPTVAFLGIALVQYLAKLTLTPFLTEIEILKLSALVILLFLAVQAFRTTEQWRGFVWFLLVLGFLVSLQGILQYFTFNGKLYWFRVMHFGGYPFGPYVDRDHFSGLMELVVPSGLSLLLMRVEDEGRFFLTAILTVVPVGAIVLSASRGGVASLGVEFLVVLVLALAQRRSRSQLVIAGAVLALMAAFVGWIGVGQVLERFGDVRVLEMTEGRRVEMTRDSWRIFRDHPLIGTGLGSLETVFPKYETHYDGLVVNHTHDDYVEALAETGLAGGLCGCCFLIILFGNGWRGLAHPASAVDLALRVGALGSCCGILAHSFVDFNLHVPSNAFLFLLQAGFATSSLGAAPAHHRLEETRGGEVATEGWVARPIAR